MRREFWLMIIIFAGFLLKEAWTLNDWQPGYIYPFPFSDQKIKRPTYFWMACCDIAAVGVAFVMWKYSKYASLFFKWVMWIQVMEIVEFMLNYNEPWMKIGVVPINVTIFRFFALFFVGLYCCLKCRMQ